MKLFTKIFIVIKCIIFLFILSPGIRSVYAQNSDSHANNPEQRWGIGVGLRYSEILFESPNKNVTDLVPMFYYEDDRFFLNGMSGGIRIIDGDGWRINSFLRYRFPDTPDVFGEDIRRDAWDAGIQLRHRFVYQWDALWNLMSDMKGRRYLDAGIETVFGYDYLNFRPYVGVRLKSKSFNNYYFGLEKEDLGRGIDFIANIEVRRHITGNLFLT